MAPQNLTRRAGTAAGLGERKLQPRDTPKDRCCASEISPEISGSAPSCARPETALYILWPRLRTARICEATSRNTRSFRSISSRPIVVINSRPLSSH
jgi:hypothetical protein